MELNEITIKKVTQEGDSKKEAIDLAGHMLVESGCVKEAYISKMHEREEVVTTYIGNHVAIPHGTDDAKKEIIKSGISVIQYPNGVDFGNGNTAHIVIGIAGKDNDHLDILSKIAISCQDEALVKEMSQIEDKQSLINKLIGD
ncbi:PTS sugar transporter subunit IIA [Haloplasma contractile]|uniref:Mannitol-specific phosphotransferase enzyme IIA component n=1 Tax=Haloplasma contractile SSD-17B TaxID=1033810 RepID=F7PW70_9MOLU|nr:PTS sugar transporter subunit IIA [Haloplasma contractile]ERJ11270.1 PTS system mannitol-specific IIA domain MltF protein [Haloplasma contractile SSD-17B]